MTRTIAKTVDRDGQPPQPPPKVNSRPPVFCRPPSSLSALSYLLMLSAGYKKAGWGEMDAHSPHIRIRIRP